MTEDFIYLDHNSTTPIDPRVLDAMMPYLTNMYANPSSTHKFGHEVKKAITEASNHIAELIHCQPNEIVYTSGATESINLALKGVVENSTQERKHIITVQTEHKAVLDVCKYLEGQGVRVSYLPVKPDGLIEIEDLKNELCDDTILVCVMIANNETGVIQPIRDISELVHQNGSLFFTDATQAFGKIPIDVDLDGIDMMAFSGHKIYGPKGIGGLFVRSRRPNRVKLMSQIHGGGHQSNRRSGTLNAAGIVGLGSAAEIALKEMEKDAKHTSALRDALELELLKISGTWVNGNLTHRLPNTTNIYFEGIDSDALMMGLENIIVSNGSACTSASIAASHVLTSMGLCVEQSFQCLRIGLGRINTAQEIGLFTKTIQEVSKELKNI